MSTIKQIKNTELKNTCLVIVHQQLLRLVQKISTGKSNLENLSQFSITNRDYLNLRSNNRLLSLPKLRTNALKKGYEYRGSVTWNALPQDQKTSAILTL